jgi:hypothetical protein
LALLHCRNKTTDERGKELDVGIADTFVSMRAPRGRPFDCDCRTRPGRTSHGFIRKPSGDLRAGPRTRAVDIAAQQV